MYYRSHKKNFFCRKKRSRRFRETWLRIIKLSLFLILICAFGLGGHAGWTWLATSDSFSVRAIHVEGNMAVSEKDILKRAEVKKGENIFQFHIKEICLRLMKHPWIKEVSVERGLPDTVFIQVVERVPFAIVSSDNHYLVDRDGFILSVRKPVKNPHLPVIIDKKAINMIAGERITNNVYVTGREFLSMAAQYAFNEERGIRTIKLDKGNKILTEMRDKRILFFFDKYHIAEGFEKLYGMEKILAGKEVKKIDLSYRDQVVITYACGKKRSQCNFS